MRHEHINADYLQSELERLGRKSSENHKRGICDHGWRKGQPGMAKDSPSDIQTCLHCGKTATREELDEERRERLY